MNFCQNCGFGNVNIVKKKILKKCEFGQKLDFENVNLVENMIVKV